MSELIPFGIQEAAASIAEHKAEAAKRKAEREKHKRAEELREGYAEAVNEFNTNPIWHALGLGKRDIERALEGSWREDERVLEGAGIERIIFPFTKSPRGLNFFDALQDRDAGEDHEYKLVQEV